MQQLRAENGHVRVYQTNDFSVTVDFNSREKKLRNLKRFKQASWKFFRMKLLHKYYLTSIQSTKISRDTPWFVEGGIA